MRKIRIGMIGTCGRGFSMGKLWSNSTSRAIITGGMDINQEALSKFKAEVSPDAFTTTSVDELLAHDDIDAVAVCTPDFTHEEYVIKAFQAGKHVFCEKPMAISVEGCDRMLTAWKESGKKFMIGFNMRYMNQFRVMKDIVDSGAIGEIKTVWCRHFVSSGGMWYYHDWHANSKYSTGLLLQKASHDIDIIHWITGKYTKKVIGMGRLGYYGGDKSDTLKCTSCPEQNSCIEFESMNTNPNNHRDMCVFRKEVNVEDNSTIIMELDGGIQATYMQCHYTPDYARNYTFIGTEGRIENLDNESKVIVKMRDRSKRWKNLANSEYDIKKAEGSHSGADKIICQDFVDMILDDKIPVATPLAGRMSVATACAATYSIRDESKLIQIADIPSHLRGNVF